MINWENTKNRNLKGKAKDIDHFNRLNVLANGKLRIVSEEKELSTLTKKVISEVKDQKEK